MAETKAQSGAPAAGELDEMHAVYRRGGRERNMAPQIVYAEAVCPHVGCDQPMQL